MKTSSLILLFLILTCLLAVMSIPLILQQRLSSGNYTRPNSDQNFEYDRHLFKNVRLLSLTNLSFCTIVPSDSLMVDIERKDLEGSLHSSGGDVLHIMHNNKSSSRRVRIFIPQNIRIEAKDCNLIVRGGLNHFDSLDTEIKLINSHMRVEPIFKDERMEQFWDQLTLIGLDSSDVEMLGAVVIRQLEIQNINNVKMGDHIFVENMKFLFDNRKRVYSSSDDAGLTVKSY